MNNECKMNHSNISLDYISDSEPLLGQTVYLSSSDIEMDDEQILESYNMQMKNSSDCDDRQLSERNYKIDDILSQHRSLKQINMNKKQETALVTLCIENEKMIQQNYRTSKRLNQIQSAHNNKSIQPPLLEMKAIESDPQKTSVSSIEDIPQKVKKKKKRNIPDMLSKTTNVSNGELDVNIKANTSESFYQPQMETIMI